MIVSASYRTDIPAFYGEWFARRLRSGYCMVLNPYGGKPYRVSLSREEVDGFVFWTKNLRAFIPVLNLVHERGFPFVVQYSITAYPQELEGLHTEVSDRLEDMRMLAERFGEKRGVWRYDTIVFSSLTPFEFHRENFRRLAGELEGATDEVVVSFARIYRKTRRNLDLAAEKHGFSWWDPPLDQKKGFLGELVRIAKARDMKLSVCGERELLIPGAKDASCIDPLRLSDISGKEIRAPKKSHRQGCGCFQSRDIGEYDSCPYGCAYCYAVRNHDLARKRFEGHNPEGEYLLGKTARFSAEAK